MHESNGLCTCSMIVVCWLLYLCFLDHWEGICRGWSKKQNCKSRWGACYRKGHGSSGTEKWMWEWPCRSNSSTRGSIGRTWHPEGKLKTVRAYERNLNRDLVGIEFSCSLFDWRSIPALIPSRRSKFNPWSSPNKNREQIYLNMWHFGNFNLTIYNILACRYYNCKINEESTFWS